MCSLIIAVCSFLLFTDMCAYRVFTLIDENNSSCTDITTSEPPILSVCNTAVPFSSTQSLKSSTDTSTSTLTTNTIESQNAIVFDHVCFSYRTRCDVCVLNDFNVNIPLHKITCVNGKSGGGKSTILSLLSGMCSVV